MKSFGLWYLVNKEKQDQQYSTELKNQINNSQKQSGNTAAEQNDPPEFDLHVNFWSLEDYKHMDSKIVPCLDIGIKIKKYRSIEKLTFFCPFTVMRNDVLDLADKMSTKNTANIIFNTDCELHTKDNYTIIELGHEQLLIFPLNQVIKDVYSIQSGEYGTKLEFNFQNFQYYVSSNPGLEELDIIYIRFRIKGNALKHHIYFDSEPLNKSFESAFSGTRMIDFKINEKRNIEEKVRAEIIVNHEELAKLKAVHFLLMEPSAYGVESFDDHKMSCRELEKGLWDNYLGMPIDFTKGHILAYHWRKRDANEGFNCLIKVNYSKTKPLTIFVYAMVVVALGIISSAGVTAIAIFWPDSPLAMLVAALLGFSLICIGILIGKHKGYKEM